MNINLKTIRKLKPCRSRLDNFVEHYAGFNGSMKQFLNLKNITHKDKLWVFFRLIPTKDISKVAAAMAEKVLPVFEAKYPDDKRPRLAIEAARKGDASDAYDRIADAAYAAADCGLYSASWFFALASAYYAARVAYAAANIHEGFTDSVIATEAAYHNATEAAENALLAAPNQEAAQLKIMKRYLK